MNISAITPSYKIYNKQASKNDISFGKSPEALIDDLMNNQRGQSFNMKRREIISILNYFGFSRTGMNGDDAKYEGPYGQCITVVIRDNEYPEVTKKIKEALKRLDLFHNELVPLEKPTEDDIKFWQELTGDKNNIKNTGDKFVNRYAQNLAETEDEEIDDELSKQEVKSKNQEIYGTISEQRMAILELSQLTDDCVKSFNLIKDDYESVKEELECRNYKDKDKLLSKVEKAINDTKDLFVKVQKEINQSNAKFQNGQMLTDEELKDLYDTQIKIRQNIDYITLTTSDLETIYLETSEREDAIQKESQEIFGQIMQLYNEIKEKVDDFKKSTDKNSFYFLESYINLRCANKMHQISQEFMELKEYNPKTTELTKEEYNKQLLERMKYGYEVLKSAFSEFNETVQVREEITKLYNELIKTYTDFSENIKKYQKIYDKNAAYVQDESIKETCKKGLEEAKHSAQKIEKKIKALKKSAPTLEGYKQQLESIKGILEKANSSSKGFEDIINILNKEFAILDSEFEEHRKERLERTLKRFSKYQQEQAEETKQETSDSEIIQPEEIIETVEQFLNQNQENIKLVTDVNDISSYKEEISRKIREYYSNPDNQKSIHDLYTKLWGKKSENVIKFSQMLAKQMAPLEFDETIYLLSYLISTYIKDVDIEKYKNDSNASLIFINSIGNKALQSSEGQRIKNATRFAFLESIYNASANKDGQIYTIDKNAVKTLHSQVKQGKKEIRVTSKNKILNISLKKPVNLDDINYSIKAYVMPMKFSAKTDKVIDTLFEFSPEDNEQLRNTAKEFLKTQGLYYEFLADSSCEYELKKILLEAFWTDFEKASDESLNLTSQIIKNYDEKQKEIQAVEEHKKKINIIKSQNWNL